MIQTIGLIGYGHFGAFLQRLAERYIPDIRLKVHSGSRSADGGLFVSLEEAAACDAVILTVPISVYEETLQRIKPHLGADTIIVDVATVKKYTSDLIRGHANGQRFISMHPMFGPESYSKRDGDVSGFRIVVTDSNLDRDLSTLLFDHLRQLGFSLIETTADQHDRDLAETLFLTHYVGQVIARGSFERTEIDSVSFGYLMDAVDSVRHDTQLFEDVFRFNPYCKLVVERFDKSEKQVKDRLLAGLPEKS